MRSPPAHRPLLPRAARLREAEGGVPGLGLGGQRAPPSRPHRPEPCPLSGLPGGDSAPSGPETGVGEGGRAPGRTKRRVTGSPPRRRAAGARGPTGSAAGRGASDGPEGAASPGQYRGRPASPRGGCRRSANTIKGRKPGGSAGAAEARGPPNRVLHVGGAGLGARGGRAPLPGVPPAPPRARGAPGTHLRSPR